MYSLDNHAIIETYNFTVRSFTLNLVTIFYLIGVPQVTLSDQVLALNIRSAQKM